MLFQKRVDPREDGVFIEFGPAMRAAINCALANRQIITHLTRAVFDGVLPQANLSLLYDVSHNTCKEEDHISGNRTISLFVHRKGATPAGTGVLGVIPGSMADPGYVVRGLGNPLSLASAAHGHHYKA